MNDELERCILQKPEVFVYKIPPRQSARGYRAADWSLSNPDWTGRMRVMEKSKTVILKLEDRGSNDLFAACPIEAYPGPALEAVTDSSRYFVIRIVNDVTKQNAYIGMGFADRSDSFDLNVALQDHFNFVKKEDKILQEDRSPAPLLDLAFKEGQTIKVSIRDFNQDKEKEKEKTKPKSRSTGILLPPPSSSSILPPPSSGLPPPSLLGSILPPASSKVSAGPPSKPTTPLNNNLDLLADFGDLQLGGPVQLPPPIGSVAPAAAVVAQDDPWGDFASADAEAKKSGEWVQF
jgi:hypothetical protein